MNIINQIEKNDSNTEYDENQNIKVKFNLPSNKGSNCENMPYLVDNVHLKNKAQILQKELNEINSKVNDFLQDITTVNQRQNGNTHTKYQQQQHESTKSLNGNSTWSSMSLNMTTKMYAQKTNNDELPERIFVKRNSLLTEMFKINHIRTIRNIFTSIMIVVALQVVFDDLIDSGKINMNFDMIFWCFSNFSIVFYTWLYMKLSTTVLVYCCFHYWSKNRLLYIAKTAKQETSKKNKQLNLFDLVWTIGFIFYLIAFLILPASVVITNKLPPASAAVVLLEQIRMLMKSYAFVRSNIPRALKNGEQRLNASSEVTKKTTTNNHQHTDHSSSETEKKALNYKKLVSTSEQADSEDDDIDSKTATKENIEEINQKKLCPDFSNYLYFLFAPTFIYRDNYPRNSRIKWHYVFNQLIQIIGAIIYVYYILVRYCIPVFKHFNTEHVTVKMFISSILSCHLPGTLLLLILFYALLHCWLNAFSEMLRFADRMFYKDWWNSTNYQNYYRTWNVVVHDWLYTYIYKDLYYILGKKNRVACQFAIFLISATFHEYVITLAFGFFYPVLFVMFGAIGFGCLFLKSDKNTNLWNFITWIGLQIGLGGLMCLYSIEWFARKNCTQSIESPFWDYVLPRSFTCGNGLNMPINSVKYDL